MKLKTVILIIALVYSVAVYEAVAAHVSRPLVFYKSAPTCANPAKLIFPSSLLPYSAGMTVWVCE